MTRIVTPPSLKWLARKRAELAGQIDLADKIHKKALAGLAVQREKLERAHEAHLELLRRDLASVDATIRLHDIPVDPKKIRTLQVQDKPRRTSYGELTRHIYGALTQRHPSAISTHEITAYVKVAMKLDLSLDEAADLHWRVRHRLQGLRRNGKVERLHAAKTAKDGRWRYPLLCIQNLQSASIALVVGAKAG
ncbi:MAG: hypothetical protein KF796_14080 [Ramlibacter sp.]|nr:hypothetical protein [Ramlibacter sp.]